MTKLLDIMVAYTHVLTNILACKTLDQLESCQNLINNMSQYSDRPEYNDWIKKLNTAYLKKQHEL